MLTNKEIEVLCYCRGCLNRKCGLDLERGDRNSQRANQQSHSRIFLKIFPRPSTKICQEHFQPLAATSLFHHQ